MSVLLWIVAGLAALAVVVVVTVGAVLCRTATARNAPQKEASPEDDVYAQYTERLSAGRMWFLNMKPEDLYMESFDGLRLRARFLQHENPRGTAVLMHGYRGDPLQDFGCAVRFYYDLGWNVLLPDERAHWESEGKRITYGIRERCDCRDWVEQINERCGVKPVVLHGVSMGAATVLMSTGLKLPQNVRAVIADCGYTSPYAIFCHVIRTTYHLPAVPFVPVAGVFVRLAAGFWPWAYSTLDAMRQNTLPTLFIHGAADAFVPCSMSLENYEACKADKQLLLIEGAQHAQSFLVDTARCTDAIAALLARYAV